MVALLTCHADPLEIATRIRPVHAPAALPLPFPRVAP